LIIHYSKFIIFWWHLFLFIVCCRLVKAKDGSPINLKKPPRILVAIPARNEAGRIGGVIRSIQRVLPAVDIAVVNDDSRDSTAREAAAAGAFVLPLATNLGYGAALETAYLFARDRNYEVVMQMDGDGQHLAEELPRILAPILAGEADLVLGSRFMAGSAPFPSSPLRRSGQRLFSGILRLCTGRHFTDPTSGFQALGGSTLSLFASGVFPCDYPDADVILMAHLAGLRIREVAVSMRAREGGASMHAGWKPIYYGLKMLLSIFIVILNYPTWRKWRRCWIENPSPVTGSAVP
jgi:glycosyltransferase involved in cell wall biosynthesis